MQEMSVTDTKPTEGSGSLKDEAKMLGNKIYLDTYQ